MKIVRLFISIFVVVAVQNIGAYSYGIDSYYHKPRWVKLHFRACSASYPMYVPANRKGVSLGSAGGCCITKIELLDENQKPITDPRFNQIPQVISMKDGYIDRAETGKHSYQDIACLNRNFVIDKAGRVGMWKI